MVGTLVPVSEIVGISGSADGAVLIAEGRTDSVAVDDVIAAADHRLPIREGRPGEIQAWTEAVLVCREDVRRRVRRSAEINQTAFIWDVRILNVEVKVGQRICPLAEPAEKV